MCIKSSLLVFFLYFDKKLSKQGGHLNSIANMKLDIHKKIIIIWNESDF